MKNNLVIFYTPTFKKNFDRLPKKTKQIAYRKENVFRKNPLAQSLKTHKLTGKLKDYWSFSIDYRNRIVFRFIKKNKILFVDAGTHEVYK